jgi:hypothetical protein
MFLGNIGWLSADYTALYRRRQNSSFILFYIYSGVLYQKTYIWIFTRKAVKLLFYAFWRSVQFIFYSFRILQRSYELYLMNRRAVQYGKKNFIFSGFSSRRCCSIQSRYWVTTWKQTTKQHSRLDNRFLISKYMQPWLDNAFANRHGPTETIAVQQLTVFSTRPVQRCYNREKFRS